MARKRAKRSKKTEPEVKKGRPPKPPGEKQSKLIQPKFTPAEHAAIEEVAKRSGMALATWARVKLLEAAGLTDSGKET